MPERPLAGEEPAARNRNFARECRGMYVALVQEGFSVDEALRLIGDVLAAAAKGGDAGA